MHEGSIAGELVEQAIARARGEGIGRIASIRVRLGEDSLIPDDTLRFWFDLAKEGTLAEGAVLDIERGEGHDIFLTFLSGEACNAG